MKKDLKKNILKESLAMMLVVVLVLVLLSYYPEKTGQVISTISEYMSEMILIFPAIVIIMGLFAVFVPDRIIEDYLGRSSGIRGMLIALFLGTLPTGPLYVAFPIASVWIKKGASPANIVMFLTAWACIKIPQEILEFQFLGLRFMLLRLVLTIIFAMLMGSVIGKMMMDTEKGKKKLFIDKR